MYIRVRGRRGGRHRRDLKMCISTLYYLEWHRRCTAIDDRCPIAVLIVLGSSFIIIGESGHKRDCSVDQAFPSMFLPSFS